MSFIALKLDALLDLAPFVGDDKHRVYLHGVHIDASTGHYVATDGATLAALEVAGAVHAPAKKFDSSQPSEWGWIIRTDKDFVASVKRIRKAFKPVPLDTLYVPEGARSGDVVTAYVGAADTPQPEIVNAELAIAVKMLHGVFPEWQRVVPSSVGEATNRSNIQIKPDLLNRFALGGDTSLYLFAPKRERNKEGKQLDGAETPILVLRRGRPDFFGVIMPCAWRDKHGPQHPLDHAPNWLQQRLGHGASDLA